MSFDDVGQKKCKTGHVTSLKHDHIQKPDRLLSLCYTTFHTSSFQHECLKEINFRGQFSIVDRVDIFLRIQILSNFVQLDGQLNQLKIQLQFIASFLGIILDRILQIFCRFLNTTSYVKSDYGPTYRIDRGQFASQFLTKMLFVSSYSPLPKIKI